MGTWRSQWLQRIGLIGAIGLLMACQSLSAPKLSPLPQDPSIQAYFNHNEAKGAEYREPYRDLRRAGDNLEQILIDAANSAQTSLDIAVQEFRIPNLAKALVQQQQKGVRVRVLIEHDYRQPVSQITPDQWQQMEKRERDRYKDMVAFLDRNQNGSISPQEAIDRDALVILEKAEVPLIDDRADGTRGSGLMHHKFMVIDNKSLIVTSANFTLSDLHGDYTRPQTRGNDNNLLKIESPALAQRFSEEFDIMWGDRAEGIFNSRFGVAKPARPPKTVEVGEGNVTVKFSPNSTTAPWESTTSGLIAQTLQKARKAVNLALFVFSDQKVANILQTRRQQGIEVKALIDPEFAYRPFSEALDMLGVAIANNCKFEANNQLWSPPIATVGIPTIPVGDKLHHKFGVVDRQTVITGSHNWSAAANHQNDETLLVIDNPTVAAHYQREFERLYRNAQLGLPEALRQKAERDRQKCAQVAPNNSTSSASSRSVNINQATTAELDTLPGIGATTAEKIIAERNIRPFSSLEDLKRVAGIGQAKLEKLRGKVAF
jgi:competence ComEA-like helix-hairpin-helix protein